VLALISFDAPSCDLLDRLCDEGALPRLAELRAASAPTIRLSTPATRFPAGAYPTLWSGVPLERHGLHYPFMWDARAQRVRSSAFFPAPSAMWESIAAVGGRALVVDPYEARAPHAIQGLCLNGWQFRNRIVLRPWARPEGVRRGFERRFGPAPAAEEVFGEPDGRRLRELAATLEEAPARLSALVEATVGELRPDLLVCGLSTVHLAGHQLTDPAAVLPRMDDTLRRDLDGALERVYAAADRALGSVVDALPAGADVVVFAVHGMARETSRTDLLGGMLHAVLTGVPARDDGARNAWRVRAAVPASLRARVGDALPDGVATELAARLELRGVDWAHTRAFVVPSDAQGLIRFNVRGRERRGVVDPGDAPALADEIRAGLATFAAESGAPAVAGVDVVSRLAGATEDADDLLPDLVVHWSREPTRRGERLVSDTFGTVRRAGAGSGRSGNHTDDAWALVVPGAGRARRPPAGDILDIAATALARFGVEHAGTPLLASP
jgi:hypothetical protein